MNLFIPTQKWLINRQIRKTRTIKKTKTIMVGARTKICVSTTRLCECKIFFKIDYIYRIDIDIEFLIRYDIDAIINIDISNQY